MSDTFCVLREGGSCSPSGTHRGGVLGQRLSRGSPHPALVLEAQPWMGMGPCPCPAVHTESIPHPSLNLSFLPPQFPFIPMKPSEISAVSPDLPPVYFGSVDPWANTTCNEGKANLCRDSVGSGFMGFKGSGKLKFSKRRAKAAVLLPTREPGVCVQKGTGAGNGQDASP